MDQNEEYHDPDYPGVSAAVKEEVPKLSEDEKVEKIKTIIRREFLNELEVRENEVMLIEQRMSTSRRLLQRLRYVLVNNYFHEQKLQLSGSQIEDDVAAQHEPRARAEISTLLRDGQRRLHPSVRKLLGKKTADLAEIFKTRAPRNKSRKDYQAMVQSRNYTISADATKSLRPDKKQEEEEPSTSGAKPKKVPRQIDPQGGQVLTLEDVTRNKMKHRYRLIIGNTSKFAPPASRADRSTHKWLLYVRGPASRPDPAPVLTRVVATLHHSYAPHHTVHVDKPPFHITRRGWGEFPARVELHFPLPEVNRPTAVEHTIKLDRNYTGLQTLGSETIIEVWLYSTPEMLEFEYVDPISESLGPPDSETHTDDNNHIDEQKPDKMEVEPETDVKEVFDQTDSWMEFFSKDTTELDVDEMIIKPVKKEQIEEKNDIELELDANAISKEDEVDIKTEFDEVVNDVPDIQSVTKRIMKYIDSTTGKIYYLEMDRTLDLSKVQEIVINNTKVKISPIKSNGLKSFRRKKGVSLLKPEVQNQLKSENCKLEKPINNFTHIENDHCYLGYNWYNNENENIENDSTNVLENVLVEVKKEKSHLSTLCGAIKRFACVKVCVNYLLKNIPIITDRARDPDYVRDFPFVVENSDRYWRLDFAKRRNIEWSRAKLINKMLTEQFSSEMVWRTKQILIYSHLHSYQPTRQETAQKLPETDEWSSWNDLENSRLLESNIKEIYPNPSDICTLTLFDSEQFQNTLSDTLELTDSDEEIDIVGSNVKTKVKTEVLPDTETSLTVLPVENEEDRLRFMYIEKKCADIGIELKNEDVGSGYSYSAVHAVLLSAMKSFAEELIRSAAAAGASRGSTPDALPLIWTGGWGGRALAGDVLRAVRGAGRAGGAGRGAGGGRLGALAGGALGARAAHARDAL